MQSRLTTRGLVTGSRNGVIRVWVLDTNSGQLHQERKHVLMHEISNFPSIKSVCEHPKSGSILAGTRGGEIVEFGELENTPAKILMRAHYDKEVCGIAPHPTKNEVLTAGREGILAIWDTVTRR